jgi:hypothetical protein
MTSSKAALALALCALAGCFTPAVEQPGRVSPEMQSILSDPVATYRYQRKPRRRRVVRRVVPPQPPGVNEAAAPHRSMAIIPDVRHRAEPLGHRIVTGRV